MKMSYTVWYNEGVTSQPHNPSYPLDFHVLDALQSMKKTKHWQFMYMLA